MSTKMAVSCVRRTLLLPFKSCTQVRLCCTFPTRLSSPSCTTWTPTRPPPGHILTQQTRSYSDVTARQQVDYLPTTDVHQLTLIEDAGQLDTSLDLDAWSAPRALEEISEEEAATMPLRPPIPPASTSLQDYVDHSETLTKLVQLGVPLWRLQQRPHVGSMLLRLDFHTHVAPRLLFLKETGVEDSRLGHVVSLNPFILTEDLDNLRARVHYLRSKKFPAEEVASMVSRAPYLLNFSLERLDNRLGFYQQQLGLSAAHTRQILARLPRLLCGSLEPVKENLKVCELELGFKTKEIQHIVLVVPKVLTANKRKLIQIFHFVHNTMKVPHHLIVKFPQVLNSKFLRVRERHLFLQYLGKDQYDPAQANYVPLQRLVSLPDQAFCTEVAQATLGDFGMFQKTL
ncbi:transcription termination factor 3, mitochondrial-like isoform X1 [Entelurus aequoreus]|uniref:transcription termination factor 3, mitochondrial-like isoform X1 n=2 Tax=Entelurus aequoreus TaxID=161455 RepID=UPI002B1DDAB1|nr:transcription termination factor 3, mitochondrial-like isoform X1 [Entelurus aequoreus]